MTDDECVMAAISKLCVLGEEAYGVAIQNLLEASGRRMSYGRLYVCLDRLESTGRAVSRLAPGGPERGGRAKKIFRLTRAGARDLRGENT